MKHSYAIKQHTNSHHLFRFEASKVCKHTLLACRFAVGLAKPLIEECPAPSFYTINSSIDWIMQIRGLLIRQVRGPSIVPVQLAHVTIRISLPLSRFPPHQSQSAIVD